MCTVRPKLGGALKPRGGMVGKLRVATWNAGIMTGRSREFAGILRRRVNIACVQETKWRGNKVKEIWDEYKMLYTGKFQELRVNRAREWRNFRGYSF